jgi:hypothetical protein
MIASTTRTALPYGDASLARRAICTAISAKCRRSVGLAALRAAASSRVFSPGRLLRSQG